MRGRIPVRKVEEEIISRDRLDCLARGAVQTRRFLPVNLVCDSPELRDILPFDVVLPPNRDKVIAYGGMYNGTLVAHCDCIPWDYELLFELHRRGKWKFHVVGKWVEGEIVDEAEPQNQEALRRYDQRWGIVMKDGKTWINKEDDELEQAKQGRLKIEHRSRRRREVRRRRKNSRFNQLQSDELSAEVITESSSGETRDLILETIKVD